jgi:hypothetical protein
MTKKHSYLYNVCTLEPLDGSASIPLNDGNVIGAIFNAKWFASSCYVPSYQRWVCNYGFKQAYKTQDAAVQYGRLEPGKNTLVDMNEGAYY